RTPGGGIDVEHGEPGAADLGELHGGEADGAGADDEHLLALLRGAALDRVVADAERLDERERVGREVAGGVELAGRQDEAGPEAAVGHHAEDLEVLAAVAAAGAAGAAFLAVEVGLHRAA